NGAESESQNSGSARGRDRRRERDERRGRSGRDRHRSLSPEEAVLPAVTSQHEPEPAPQPFSDDVPAFEVAETVLEAVEEFHETVAEYEPDEEASASYRVDPAGPSEFRQGSTIDESMEPVDAEAVAQVRLDETHGFAADTSHEFTSVQPTGEMISEWPLTPENPTAEPQPSAPIEHETAVQ